MNSGWLSFKLKLEQHLSEAARLIKSCTLLLLKGWAPPLSNKPCGSEHSGLSLLNAKYLDLKRGLQCEKMTSFVFRMPRNNPFSQRNQHTMTHAIH